MCINPGGNVPVEQGYNTDARPLQYDENNSPVFTRSLPLSEVPVVVHNGIAYREFLLDINQKASAPLLSLDELRLYVGNAPNLHGYDPKTHQLAGLEPAYDLDAGGDHYVLLNARLSHGSGSGDMILDVPDALLTQGGGSDVYLYSKFGVTDAANAGYEEWAVGNATSLSSLSGFVTDVSNVSTGGQPIPVAGVLVTLTGTTNSGQSVTLSTQTNANGFYLFSALPAGTYTISEQVPSPYTAAGSTVGTLKDTSADATDFFGIALPPDVIGCNYDFQLILSTTLGWGGGTAPA